MDIGAPKIGKKQREWLRYRPQLIKEAVAGGRITITRGEICGICEDCKRWKKLDPDHKRKRSLGGTHDKENIAWVCRTCHNKRDNLGDPMGKKTKTKKPEWAKRHRCRSCGFESSLYICPACGKPSIKLKGISLKIDEPVARM